MGLFRRKISTGAETLFIGYLLTVGIWRVKYNTVCQEMRDWLGAGESWIRDDVVCSKCCV